MAAFRVIALAAVLASPRAAPAAGDAPVVVTTARAPVACGSDAPVVADKGRWLGVLERTTDRVRVQVWTGTVLVEGWIADEHVAPVADAYSTLAFGTAFCRFHPAMPRFDGGLVPMFIRSAMELPIRCASSKAITPSKSSPSQSITCCSRVMSLSSPLPER